MKDRYYIKDKVDGQQHYISGDEMGYLIDVTDILEKKTKQALKAQREEIKGVVRKLATCLDCKGRGITMCDAPKCSDKEHECGYCFGTGERSINKEDIIKKLDNLENGGK